MKKSFITLFFLIKISTYSFSQIYNYDSKKLLCGPMLSYIDNYRTQMWMLVSIQRAHPDRRDWNPPGHPLDHCSD